MPPCMAGTVRQSDRIIPLTSSHILFDSKSHISGAINVNEITAGYLTHLCLPDILA